MSNQSKGRPGGVLPINAAATKKAGTTQKSAQRSPAPRLRLIIRRLPPGLTETEFWDALGAEWQTGNGKVDWHAFKQGKISKDPAKPSRPGRAYIKVKDQLLLEALSAKVKNTPFKDARATGNDPCLVGPPCLEFAPYSKSPSSRNRNDGRQGTIDQDQEFIDFLQSLTEPITKLTANGTEASDLKQDKITTTPLVQFIKEKKANRVKEKEAAAAAKSSKKNQEGKEGKAKGESRPTIVVKSNSAAAEKARVTKATQEAVKAANKSAAQIQNKTTTSKPESKAAKDVASTAAPAATASATPAPVSAPVAKPERRRGSASTASKMIARDLGLATKEPRAPRAARNASNTVPSTNENAVKAETQTKTASPASVPATASKANTSATTTPTAALSTQAPPTGPRNNRSQAAPQAKQAQPVAQRPSKPPPQPTPGAKSAFLKHANPSQGVTEDLLRTTFSVFGGVTRCEIDKKKGLGYVDFTDTEALKKAMGASPIKVGNGQVVVLENKSPYHKRQTQSTNTGQQQSAAAPTSKAASANSSAAPSAVTSPQPVPAAVVIADPPPSNPTAVATTSSTATTIVTNSETLPSIEIVNSTGTPSATPPTPTAPKGARGGSNAPRGGRGSTNFHQNRGGGSQGPNRGRGGFRNRGARGNKAGANGGSAAGSNGAALTAPSTVAPATDQRSTADVDKTASADQT